MAWLDRLEAEHDNLGAAISWFLDQDRPGPALQLSGMTWQYWWLRGHTEESARYGEVIVASGEKLRAGQLGYAQVGLGVLFILSGGKARRRCSLSRPWRCSAGSGTSAASRSPPVTWVTWPRCAGMMKRPASC
ncbi:MAG TPA: hypothetical protein VJ418_13230 [Streptosporangiaceae bacterium]|nr:hypothetical protein [Streptosporangiaceae bacterium]